MINLLIMPIKQIKNIVYLSYIHTLLEYAYDCHVQKLGEDVLEGKQIDFTNKLMLDIKEHFEKMGWTHDNLDKIATPIMRKYYNYIHPIIRKEFKAGIDQYIPSFLALVMLHRVRHWKGIVPEQTTEALTYFVNKLKTRREERAKYYQITQKITNKLKIEVQI